MVLLGDQEPLNDLAVELGPGVAPKTWWIYGNHDSDYLCYFENHAPMAHHNLHALGYQLIGDLARAMGVKMIIHGHHHERYSATITGGIRVEGLGLARANEGFFWLDHGLGERP